MRLNKYLARCGLGSRRNVEKFIFDGRVIINGYQVTEPGFDVQEGDEVTVDDQPVTPERKIYLVMNKPRGYICAVSDRRYPVILDLLPRKADYFRLFPVGRLDLQSEGIIMLTNDGDFSQEMIHPSSGITKEYEVLMDHEPTPEEMKQLRRGTVSEGKRIRPVEVDIIPRRRPDGQWLRFVLNEGIKREIRIIAEAAGMRVQVLFRRKIGKMELRHLKVGCVKEYTADQLRKMVYQGGTV